MAINFKDWQKNLQETVQIDEALKGDQHKLDVDKDGKIEGSDLKKLRSKKETITFNNGKEVKENENCGKKMYREFVEEIEELAEIAEAKKDDYWDFKDLKEPPTTRKVAGTRYGGSAQKDEPEDDDEDAPKKKKVDQPKRGRGRPKGAKSGARQQGNNTKKTYGGLAIHSLNLPSKK